MRVLEVMVDIEGKSIKGTVCVRSKVDDQHNKDSYSKYPTSQSHVQCNFRSTMVESFEGRDI